MEETSTQHSPCCETVGGTLTKFGDVERDVELPVVMDSVSVSICFVLIFLKTYGRMTYITDEKPNSV